MSTTEFDDLVEDLPGDGEIIPNVTPNHSTHSEKYKDIFERLKKGPLNLNAHFGAQGLGFASTIADTAAMTAALGFLAANGDVTNEGNTRPTIELDRGDYWFGDLPVIEFRGLDITGLGRFGTTVSYTGTATLFAFGEFSDDPSDGGAEPEGYYGGPAQGARIRNMMIRRSVYPEIPAEGSGVGTAIADNGSGDVTVDECIVLGFAYGFQGSYGSDFSQITNSFIGRCDIAAYFGPHCQQVKIEGNTFYFNREGLVVEGAPQGSCRDNYFMGSGISSVTFDGHDDETRLGLPYPGSQNYEHSFMIEGCWFETFVDGGFMGRNAPRQVWVTAGATANADAVPRYVKVRDSYMVAGGDPTDTCFFEFRSGTRHLIDGLLIYGAGLEEVVTMGDGGPFGITLKNVEFQDPTLDTIPLVTPTVGTGWQVINDRSRRVTLPDDANEAWQDVWLGLTGSQRWRWLYHPSGTVGLQFWSGSAWIERITFDPQNRRVIFEDSSVARVAPKVTGTRTDECFRTGLNVTGSRPSAATAGAGSQFYDTTLGIPIWSNGTVWKDAAGTTV